MRFKPLIFPFPQVIHIPDQMDFDHVANMIDPFAILQVFVELPRCSST